MKKSLHLVTKEVDDIKKKDLVEIRGEIEVVRKLQSENDTKLETAIEAKLVKQVQVNITSKVDDKLKSMKDDMSATLEIERRRSNLIFHGVKEEDNDDEVRHLIEEILRSGLNLDHNRHIEEVCRIGKRASGKIRPVCIKTKSEESKVEILQRAKQLKNHVTFKKVFITPDLTRKQQEVDTRNPSIEAGIWRNAICYST